MPETALAPAASGADLIATFLASHGPTTMAAYERDLLDFAAFVGSASPAEAITALLGQAPGDANRLALAYRTRLRERGLAPATINRRLAALRSLTRLARLLGTISWAIEIPNLRSEAYRDTRGPGKDAVQQLLAAASDSPRDRAILHLLYDLGLRRAEVCQLDLTDLELRRGTVTVRGKGRLEKVPLTLPQPTRTALADWLAVRGSAAGPLFPSFDRSGKGDGRLTGRSIHRLVGGYGAAIGVRATPHGLRHTAITEACKAAAAAGIGIEEVLDFSRHQSVAVLMRYRDRERNVQAQLAELVAGGAS